MFDPRRKSPALAAVLSVIPGVGQLYIGYYVRGFAVAAIFGLTVISADPAPMGIKNTAHPYNPLLGVPLVLENVGHGTKRCDCRWVIRAVSLGLNLDDFLVERD